MDEERLKDKVEKAKKLLAVISLPLIAAVCFFVVTDRATAGARLVHVVNASPADVTLQIGELKQAVSAGKVETIELPEGRHQVVIEQAGRPPETLVLNLEGSFAERLADRTAFVINVRGAALLLWEQEEFGKVPAGNHKAPRQFFGEPFLVLRDVDYAFLPFPETIKASGGTLVRSRLSVFRGPRAQALGYFAPESSQALDYAELHLDPASLDEDLLGGYVRFARDQKQLARVVTFLSTGLKPIAVPWHRVYQDLVRSSGEEGLARLRVQYEELLKAAPNDSALLYLCGRIAADPSEGLRRYRQAVQADPKSAFANFALAVRAFRRGDHAAALPHVKLATEQRPRDPRMEDLAFRVRFAQRDYDSLAEEIALRRKADPINLLRLRRALEVEAARGDAERTKDLAQAFRQTVRGRSEDDPLQLVLHAELLLLRLDNKLEALREKVAQINDPALRRRLVFQACLQLDDLAAAEAAVGEAGWAREASLLLCLAWTRRGDDAGAERWRERAQDLLSKGSADERKAGTLLAQASVSVAEVDALALPPATKATLLQLFGHQDAAKRFDITLYFPHRFLDR